MSTPESESLSDEEILGRRTNTDTGDIPVLIPVLVRVRVAGAPVHEMLGVDDAVHHRLAPAPPVPPVLPKLPDPPAQEVTPCIWPATARKHALRILDLLMLQFSYVRCVCCGGLVHRTKKLAQIAYNTGLLC